jgi:minor histocompatibility antigen H13
MELKGTYLISLYSREKSSGDYSIQKFVYYFGYFHIFLFAVASAIGGFYAYSKHWIVSNFYGECLSISAIQLLNLDSFQTGIILLGGLFFYDVCAFV